MDKKIFRDISYGMYFVTTKDNKNKNVGCIINTLTQITSSAPIIAISLNKDNYTNQALKQNKLFAISLISVDTPKEAIVTFGYQTSKNTNKFQNINYEVIKDIPVIQENTCGYILAEIIQTVDANTHDIIIAKVLDTKKENDTAPMTYKYYHENLKGTSPKNAPTYISEETTTTSPTSSKYQCTLCGYIYDDSKEEIKFEDLPTDWTCPLCGATKDQFKKIS